MAASEANWLQECGSVFMQGVTCQEQQMSKGQKDLEPLAWLGPTNHLGPVVLADPSYQTVSVYPVPSLPP